MCVPHQFMMKVFCLKNSSQLQDKNSKLSCTLLPGLLNKTGLASSVDGPAVERLAVEHSDLGKADWVSCWVEESRSCIGACPIADGTKTLVSVPNDSKILLKGSNVCLQDSKSESSDFKSLLQQITGERMLCWCVSNRWCGIYWHQR